MNSINGFNGFYCKKCYSIPLIEILPVNNNTSIFFFCKCNKKSYNIDLFNKIYYQKNIELNKISSSVNSNEYKKLNFTKITEREKLIYNIIDEFNKIKNEFYKYSKNIKDNLVNSLILKIKKINTAYEKYLLINKKIENVFNILIESYKILNNNFSNIINLINNSNFNKIPKYLNCTYDYAISFYEKEFIIKIPEQLKTVNRFYNHLKGVNCFLDYKINNNYYGVSSSFDSNIAYYDLNTNKHLFTFKADLYEVNWISISSLNNIISCGRDFFIKIWPLIDCHKIKEINNILTNGKQIELTPLYQYKCEEIINKIEFIINKNKDLEYDYLLGTTNKSIYLFTYKYNDKNDVNNEPLILISEFKNERIHNFIYFNRDINSNNNCNDFLCVIGDQKIILLNYPKLIKIKENNNKLKISLINRNNCIQLNNKEILLIEYKFLTIFNILNFQKKISIKTDGIIDCITKLKDGTIIQGGQNGIKRYLQYNFLEIPILSNGYDSEDFSGDYFDIEDYNLDELECILCIKELIDGRIVVCFQHKAINISKLNVF